MLPSFNTPWTIARSAPKARESSRVRDSRPKVVFWAVCATLGIANGCMPSPLCVTCLGRRIMSAVVPWFRQAPGVCLHLSNRDAGCSSSARDKLSMSGGQCSPLGLRLAACDATAALKGRRPQAMAAPSLSWRAVPRMQARVPEQGGGDGLKPPTCPQNHAPPSAASACSTPFLVVDFARDTCAFLYPIPPPSPLRLFDLCYPNSDQPGAIDFGRLWGNGDACGRLLERLISYAP